MVRLFFPVLLCIGASALGQVPVTLTSRVDSKGSGEALVTNLKAVPLTSYLIQIFLEPCNPSPRPEVFRASDSALASGGAPIAQFQSRTEPLGIAHCNKVGVSVPGRAELKAAIYQDGSSFGEPKWVNSLLDCRRFELEQIETVLTKLRSETGRVRAKTLESDIDEALAAAQEKKNFAFACPLDVRELALENLKAGAESSQSVQIARTLELFERLRNTLLSSRPSPR
jgi:hypothetical protein